MNLSDLRKQIDNLDTELVKLMAKRLEVSDQIGKIKEETNSPVQDLSRESEVLNRVQSLAQSLSLDPQDIESLYQEILFISKKQQRFTVSFQGAAGAYSEETALKIFGPNTLTLPCEQLDATFEAVEKGMARFAVVPVENSLEGSISRTYDLLLDSNLMVAAEHELRVSHCLIANPETNLEAVKTIYSHPQALGQCQSFLKHLRAELIPTYDTAGSVKMIKEKGLLNGAAIASERAAVIYNMKVLEREIEDNINNYTRFFVLAKQDSAPTGSDKTSVVFAVKHQAGALYDFIKELASRGINMTKLESRPTRLKPWEYNFYLDIEGHRQDENVKQALAKADDHVIFMKVLGSYPKMKKRI